MTAGAETKPDDDGIAAAILDICARRGPGKTICPSEAARALTRDGGDWRALMDDVRRVAAALVKAGHIKATQRGTQVDPLTARGPIRFQLVRQPR